MCSPACALGGAGRTSFQNQGLCWFMSLRARQSFSTEDSSHWLKGSSCRAPTMKGLPGHSSSHPHRMNSLVTSSFQGPSFHEIRAYEVYVNGNFITQSIHKHIYLFPINLPESWNGNPEDLMLVSGKKNAFEDSIFWWLREGYTGIIGSLRILDQVLWSWLVPL